MGARACGSRAARAERSGQPQMGTQTTPPSAGSEAPERHSDALAAGLPAGDPSTQTPPSHRAPGAQPLPVAPRHGSPSPATGAQTVVGPPSETQPRPVGHFVAFGVHGLPALGAGAQTPAWHERPCSHASTNVHVRSQSLKQGVPAATRGLHVPAAAKGGCTQ